MLFDQFSTGMNGMYWFIGVVEDRKDPVKLGRVRVRCYGYHSEKKSDIDPTDLPWATVMMPVTSGAVSGISETPKLVEGSTVIGFFIDGAECQEPLIIGAIPGVSLVQRSAAVGFSDQRRNGGEDPKRILDVEYKDDGSTSTAQEELPGRYPIDKHLDQSDLPKLARDENITDGWVAANPLKEKSRAAGQLGVPTAGHKSARGSDSSISPGQWDEPEIPYAAKYPFNKVDASESGHFVEIDDTQGAERIHVFHRMGSFIEWHPDGSVVYKAINGKHDISHRESREHVEGQKEVTVDKGLRITVNKDNESEGYVLDVGAGAPLSITVRGGNANLHVVGDLNILVNGNINETVTGNIIRKVGGNVIEKIGGIKKVNASLILLNCA